MERPNKVEEYKNKQEREIFDGNVSLSFLGRDPNIGPNGWSLSGLNSLKDFYSNEKSHIRKFLEKYARGNNVKTFKAPIAYPKHNGSVKTDDNWSQIHALDSGIRVLKGENFEGCEIQDGEAFIFSPADCMTIVTTDERGKVFAMHAGRDSIFDIDNPDRPNIIQNIISAYGDDADISKIKIWTGFGIGVGKHFDHPEDSGEYAEKNIARRKYLQENFGENCYRQIDGKYYIDLAQIIKNMALKSGVSEANFVYDDSFTTENAESAYSHRRGDVGRNLVIITIK